MPFRLTQHPELIHIAFLETLTDQDFGDLMRAVLAIERGADVVPYRLASLQDITGLDLEARTLWEYAIERRERRFPDRFKSALVASDPAHFGFARMFQTLNDNPPITLAIFPDEASARAWLALPGLEPPENPGSP